MKGKDFIELGFASRYSGAALRKMGVGGGPTSSKGNRENNLKQINLKRHIRRCWLRQWSPFKYPRARIRTKTSPSLLSSSPKRGRPKKLVDSPSTCESSVQACDIVEPPAPTVAQNREIQIEMLDKFQSKGTQTCISLTRDSYTVSPLNPSTRARLCVFFCSFHKLLIARGA